MGKKRIVSMATPELMPYCAELLANHREYADAQGYDYICYEERHADFAEMHPVYSRLGFLLDAIAQGAERVLWVDADVAFMDYTYDVGTVIDRDYIRVGRWPPGSPSPVLEGGMGGCWLAGYNQKNWISTYICFGLLVLRNNWLARAFLQEIADRARLNPEIDNAREQYYGYDVLANIGYAGVRACTPAEIGCFGGDWHDGNVWQPGYPTVHLAAMPWPRRQEVFLERYLPHVRKR